jgi:phosphoenolpyruvate carboxykinase (GTP)
MLPFCGYHMGDYLAHWLEMGRKLGAKAPKIFFVNWFRKGPDGRYLWPGFGDNVRVLKWMTERVDGADVAADTPIGLLPKPGSLDISGLDLGESALHQLFDVDVDGWKREVGLIAEYYAKLGDRLPERFRRMDDELRQRLGGTGVIRKAHER